MDKTTGLRIADETAHIRQSISDILTTPVGSRVKRRAYGSLLPSLIDHPGNAANRLRLMSATVMAIINWEPRIRIRSATIEPRLNGKVSVVLDAIRTTGPRTGQPFNASIPLIQ